MDWTFILYCLMAVVSIVITTFVVPWLREKIGAEQMAKLEELVQVAVQAAEQLFGPKTGAQKKSYAVELLSQQGVDTTDPVVDAMSEAQVYKLDKTTEKAE